MKIVLDLDCYWCLWNLVHVVIHTLKDNALNPTYSTPLSEPYNNYYVENSCCLLPGFTPLLLIRLPLSMLLGGMQVCIYISRGAHATDVG